MALEIHGGGATAIDNTELDRWKELPTAIVSDELNRFQTMGHEIRPVGRLAHALVGQAMTVRTMEADNLALHHAVAIAPAGAVLVIDAGGGASNAVWGGILHRAAELRGITAVIVDGYVRDSAEIASSGVTCFARGVVPAGPQKSWGGEINAPVSVGRCPVLPGDLVIADEDGIVVVPFGKRRAVFDSCLKRIEMEKKVLARLEAGETTVAIFGL